MSLSAACNFTASASSVSATGTLYAAAGTLCTLALVDSTNVYHGDVSIDCDLIPEAGQQFRLNPHGWSAKFQLPPIDTVLDITVTVSDVNGSTAQSQFNLVVVKDGQLAVTTFGADPTGSVDSLAAVNAAISSLTGTGVAILIPAGTFSLSALPTYTTDAPRIVVSKDATFTGASGSAFANLLGLTTHFQGGTAPASIKQCIPLKVVPADPNRGQYGLYLQAVENGDTTVDTTWHFGYNWDSTVASEPQAAFSIEDNWVTGGIPAVEMHIQCYLPVVGATVRPLSAYLRRDTGAISVTLEVNNGGIWEVLDHGTGKILMQASTSDGIIVGDNTYGSNTAIYGAVLTCQSNDFRVFDEAAHERLQLCTGTSDLLKMGDAGAEFFSVTTATVACGAPLSGGIAGTPLQTASASIALGHGGTTTPTAAQTAKPTLLLTDAGLTGNATVVLPTTTGPTEWTVDLTGVTFNAHTVTLEVGTNAKTAVVSAASVLRIYSDGVGKLYAWTAT